MSPPAARVRAPVTKAILELLSAQPLPVRSAVRSAAAGAIERVEAASRLDWIPLSVQLDILAALHDEVGAAGYDAFCATHFGSTVETPLMRSVFEGALRVFGLSPASLYRMFPKSWAMMSEGCGVVVVEGELSKTGTVLRVEQLPVEERHIELFVRGFRATFRGPIDVLKRSGDVELTSFVRSTRTAQYLAHWD